MTAYQPSDDQQDGVDESTDVSEENRPGDEASRRAFIRKTAEVAALSLFGVIGLDAAVEKILERLEERTATRAFAGAVGDLLHDGGIGAMAFAAEGCSCPEGMGGPNFACAADRDPPYTCPQGFSCPPQHNFQCSPFHFECSTSGEDPPFDCPTPEENPPFSCANGYLCPGVGQYAVDCNPDKWVSCGITGYDCDIQPGGQQFTCTPVEGRKYDCSDAAQFNARCRSSDNPTMFDCDPTPFSCNEGWIFDCGTAGKMNTRFGCDGEARFVCNGGTLYDFRCLQRFACNGAGQQDMFRCEANHIFTCGWPPGGGVFNCGATSFTCAAGGNRCQLPGTGVYNVDSDGRPGDFICFGASGEVRFTCRTRFDCAAVDDFECRGQQAEENFGCPNNPPEDQFQCPIFSCLSETGGAFKCNEQPVKEFDCPQPQFNCPALYNQ